MPFQPLSDLLYALLAIAGISSLLGLILLPIVFYISMLVDCINRDFAEKNDKMIWILVILFGNWLGAILYYFCVKNKQK